MQHWQIGDQVTADSLNALTEEIIHLERTVAGGGASKRSGTTDARGTEGCVYGWEVQPAGEALMVRPGRVLVGYGTDCAEPREGLTATPRWEYPWVADGEDTAGVLVPLPEPTDGAESFVVLLQCYGSIMQQDIPYTVEDDRCDGWFGEATAIPEVLDWRLRCRPIAGEDSAAGDEDGLLREWPLAVIRLGEYAEQPVVQLQWGDLCLFEVRGIMTEADVLLTPVQNATEQWGEIASMTTLCALTFDTDAEQARGHLRGRLDDHGGLELMLDKVEPLPGSSGGSATPPDAPEVPEQPSDDEEDDPLPPWVPDDDPETDPDDDSIPSAPDGYYYDAADPLDIVAERQNFGEQMGYDFQLSAGDIDCIVNETLRYTATLPVSTANAGGTYDWPEWNAYGLQMFYGVSASGAAVSVQWQSSFMGSDSLAKSAVAGASLTRSVTASARIEGTAVLDSEHAPSAYASNILSFTPNGTITQVGVVTLKTFAGPIRVRRKRLFHRYRVSLSLGTLKEITRNKAIAGADVTCLVSPAIITGSCSNIDAPVVSAAPPTASCNSTPSGQTRATGPLQPTFAASYGRATASVSVSGSSSWNQGTQSGSISGSFTISIPASSKIL